MKRLTIGLFAAASLVSLSVCAKTVTWIGGATETGSWTTASNWDTETVPTTGDTVVFNHKVTLTDKVNLGGGLTIRNAATVKIGVAMKGTGDLVKTGVGTLSFAATTYGEFKGNIQVKEGQFTVLMSGKTSWGYALSGTKSTSLLGTGTKITVSDSGILRVYGESLVLGGTSVARGRYSAGKLSRMGLAGYLDGDGKIQVGDPLGGYLSIR